MENSSSSVRIDREQLWKHVLLSELWTSAAPPELPLFVSPLINAINVTHVSLDGHHVSVGLRFCDPLSIFRRRFELSC